ncbi:hypothetical protein LTR66_015236 [Elasticomyces elasticus]|nr:hypothetical protein LTR66_015236 [Elasticomyces elasticus]
MNFVMEMWSGASPGGSQSYSRPFPTSTSFCIMPPPSNVTNIAAPREITPIAARGFAEGGFTFGAISLISHLALTPTNRIYRGLTVQFKVFIQLSAIMLGGCIFAEKRVSEFNDHVRRRNRALERSNRAWNEEQEIRHRIDAEEKVGK